MYLIIISNHLKPIGVGVVVSHRAETSRVSDCVEPSKPIAFGAETFEVFATLERNWMH